MRRLLWVSTLVACGPAPAPALISSDTMAVSAIRFQGDEGPVDGFDLDRAVSPKGDRASCGHGDFVDSVGHGGVDNQFATFFTLADAVAPGAMNSLVQQNIDDGLMILLFELDRFDDGSAEVVVRSTKATPLLGTDGRLLDRQTFALGDAIERGRTRDVRIDGPTVDAGPFDVRIEIDIFGYLYKLTLAGGRLRYELGDDEAVRSGLIGGAVSVDEILVAIEQAGDAANADFSFLGGLVADTADMRLKDGQCRAVSAAMGLDLVSAYAR